MLLNWLWFCSACLEAFGVRLALQGASAVQASQFSSGYSRVSREVPIQTSHHLSVDGAQQAQAGRSPWLGHAAVFYQCWPARLLVAATQLHRGASLIPLLCHLRSVDVLHFHLENCDKGNTLKVCKESEPVDFFFFFTVDEFKLCFSWDSNKQGSSKGDKLTSPSPVCQTRYNLSWHNFNYFQAASGRWGLKRYNIGFYV